MSWLLDVNVILASRWTTHPNHLAAKSWVDSVAEFHTCAMTELGFIRISLSAAYRATWVDAQEALKKLQARPGYRFLADDVDGTASPETASGGHDRRTSSHLWQNCTVSSWRRSTQRSLPSRGRLVSQRIRLNRQRPLRQLNSTVFVLASAFRT